MAESNWKPTPVRKCPHCGAPNNAWSSTDGAEVAQPEAGAVSLCFICGGLCVYVDGETMRPASDAEYAQWADDPLLVRARKVLSYTASPHLASSFLLMQQP